MKNNHRSQITNPKFVMYMVIMLSFSVVLRAEVAYPQRAPGHVNDFAGILAETDNKTMGEMLKNFQDSAGVDVELVTVKNVEDYGGQAADIDSFTEGLSKAWNAGSQAGKGILMIVSTGDRRIKVITSGAFGPEYDDLMLEIVNKKVIPFFRQADYSRGIYEGVREIIKQLSQKKTFMELYGSYAAGAAAAIIILCVIILSRRPGQAGKKQDSTAKPQKKQINEKQDTVVETFGGGASGGW